MFNASHMGELLKDIYGDAFINNLGKVVIIHYPSFDQAARRIFNPSWPELELKARMHCIAHGLAAGLPEDYLLSLDIILKVAETLQKRVQRKKTSVNSESNTPSIS